MNRIVDLSEGSAYIVSDLHGEWEPYRRYRDHFLQLMEAGYADRLVMLGDVIHGYGGAHEDASLEIILDVMALQRVLGPERVIMLLGNHELPHIYGVTLAKGNLVFTPRFEHALGSTRNAVIEFLKSLPFMVRTQGGVLLTHAGASAITANPDAVSVLSGFSHDSFLAEINQMVQRADVRELFGRFGFRTDADYDEAAWRNLAVTGPEDPRYLDLLKGLIAGNLEPEWPYLWEFFFSQCELSTGTLLYKNVVDRFLQAYAPERGMLTTLVTGHISVNGGYEIIGKRQLRIASWSHARPKEAGVFLLLDAGRPVSGAEDLVPGLYQLPEMP